jgi:hypothetical protein
LYGFMIGTSIVLGQSAKTSSLSLLTKSTYAYHFALENIFKT